MPTRDITIPLDSGERVSGAIDAPEGPRSPHAFGILLAHGAGVDFKHALLAAVAAGLAERGHVVLRWNFLYKELGRKLPDPPARLEKAYLAAIRAFQELEPIPAGRLVLGGKSMGGRIASHLAAKGPANAGSRPMVTEGRVPAPAGLVFLGYPLHPAKQQTELRDAHLPQITAPMLFVQGTRDALCDLALLRPVLDRLGPRASLHVIEGGDHSFELLRSAKRPPEDVEREVVDAVDRWLSALPAPAG